MSSSQRTIRAEELLSQMGWVHGLARSLVRDPNQADDIAQEAWLRASEQPSTNLSGERGLRAWLAGVTRTLARDSRRSQVRRTRRERAGALPEAQPSTIEVVTRTAMQQRLVGAVMAMEEPYRSTILLHYLDGLSSKEIAEESGVSPAAVRQRLLRGLEQLRARLDREFGGDRSLWSAALVPLSLVGRSSTAPVLSPAFTTTGGISMAKSVATVGTLKIAASIAACVGIIAAVATVATKDTNVSATRSPPMAEGESIELAPGSTGQPSEQRDPVPTTPELERPDSRVPASTQAPPHPNPAAVAPEREQPKPATSDPDDPRKLPENTLAEVRVKLDSVRAYLEERTTRSSFSGSRTDSESTSRIATIGPAAARSGNERRSMALSIVRR
jgi:RNA polymerase sigma-70 factor (ECF subfamily)